MNENPAPEPKAPSPIPEALLEMLVCPLGKSSPLRLEGTMLVCTKCGLGFLIEDGIPNMILEDAILPEKVTSLRDLACYSSEMEPEL